MCQECNMVVLINVCVTCLTSKKTLLPWNIKSESDEHLSFRDYFTASILPHIPTTSSATYYELVRAEVGTSKEKVDGVDLDLPVVPVVESFGRFVKYAVRVNEEEDIPTATRNAFEVLMASQQALQSIGKDLPDSIPEKNKRDRLYNDILQLMQSKQLKLRHDEIQSFGARLVRALRDTLWHVDGHHKAFSQRSTSLPTAFESFSGYNCPQKTKHRKRELRNLSGDFLHDQASELGFYCIHSYTLHDWWALFYSCSLTCTHIQARELLTLLQANLWEREGWRDFKQDVASLAQSLTGYVEYLTKKNKSMKLHHASPAPVRELSTHLRLNYISPSTSTLTPTSLNAIEESLYSQSNFEYIAITDMLPSDPLKKLRTVETMTTCGLRFPCILLVYSPGSNLGNLHFLWKVPSGADVASSFEQSQSVIERIRSQIPHYHTRAMRSAMYEKFGRISPATKPSALRYFYRELTGDQAAASSTEQATVDERIKQIIDMEDPSVLQDLRTLNTGQATKFNTFWEECAKFLSEDIGAAVDDRRHGQITHLARAISIRDLVEQVKSCCPTGT